MSCPRETGTAVNVPIVPVVAIIRRSCFGGIFSSANRAIGRRQRIVTVYLHGRVDLKEGYSAHFRYKQVLAKRWIQRPDFPKAFALNSRILRWERVDVEAWFLSKQEAPRLVRTVSRKTENQIVIDGVVIRRVS